MRVKKKGDRCAQTTPHREAGGGGARRRKRLVGRNLDQSSMG